MIDHHRADAGASLILGRRTSAQAVKDGKAIVIPSVLGL
jgi:hypothetical protein